MRKKICSKCGKIIYENSQCGCKPAIAAAPRYISDKDDLIHSARWRKKRLQIIKRDHYLCQRCLIKYNILNSDQLTVHHIKSRKNHPELTFEDSNLLCLCDTCNKQLGTKDVLDFEVNVKDDEYVFNL